MSVNDNIGGRKISMVDRLLLLVTGLLAAYQVGFGIAGIETLPMISYTIGYGVLLVAGLLIIILGYEILENPWVVVVSTLIPLGISLGIVVENYPSASMGYLIFAVFGFLLVFISRLLENKLLAVGLLAAVHGISGLTIFLSPILLSIQGVTPVGYSLVGVGGALIGIGGIMLAFLKSDQPILSRNTILAILPALLLAMTLCFVIGYAM
jgi:hypothetical protein